MAGLGDIIGAKINSAVGSAVGSATEFVKGKLPKGAIPFITPSATVNVTNAAGQKITKDQRVKIRVPNEYLVNLTQGTGNQRLGKLGGIVFPYTPSITYDQKADYTSQTPTHSNFAINFYQKSSITPITISGKFTVQNENDANVYLAVVHLLRSLTKMKAGGPSGDSDSGAPPPVCRLDAYGPFMLDNVPVAISNFKIELPEGVDYFTTGRGSSKTYEQTSVPTVSTITISLVPMYSRAEMQKFSVQGWLGNSNIRKAGYL
jgi:hypothetical protein